MSQQGLNRAQSQPCMGMDIGQMYKIATRENAAWGIEGYQVPKHYNDYKKCKEQQEIEQQLKKGKKPGWPAQKATKRGNFIDDYTKIRNPHHPDKNKIPNQYPLKDEWKMEDNLLKQYKSKNKVDMKADKNTYIAQIVKYEDKTKFPGPGKYSVSKSQKQLEEEKKKMAQKTIKYGELPNYLHDFEWQGNQNPGPGQYNGKQTSKETFEWENKKKFISANQYYSIAPKEWQAKHNKPTPKIDLKNIDPFPVSYETFGKLEMKTKQNKDQKSIVKHWGTTKRFQTIKEEQQKNTKLGRLSVPGVGQYPLLNKWPESKPGEKNKIKSKTQLFNYNKLSKGTEACRSIYY